MEQRIPHNFDLASFKKITDNMIATNESAYSSKWSDKYSRRRVKNYTKEEEIGRASCRERV